MGLDIRLPLGLLFATFGILLMAYGWLGNAPVPGAKAAININLWWGLVMLVFGAIMLALSRRRSAAAKNATERADGATRLESPEGA